MSENGGRLLPGRVNRENDDSPVGQLPISQSLAFPMLDAFLQFWPSIFSLSLKAITQHLWIAAPMVVIYHLIYHIIFIIYIYIHYIYISMVKPKQTVSSCQNFHSGLPIRILSSPTVHAKTPPRLTLVPPVVHHHVPRNGHNWGVYIPFSDMPKKSYVCNMYIYTVLCILYIYIHITYSVCIYIYIHVNPNFPS